jgi:hypothetical protein
MRNWTWGWILSMTGWPIYRATVMLEVEVV